MKKIISAILVVCVTLLSCNKENKNPDPKWTFYNAENGLIDSPVTRITNDQNGKIYLSQYYGITTYDNGNFNSEFLNDYKYRDIYFDNEGRIWAGIEAEDLMMLENNTWVIPNDEVHDIVHITKGQNNSLWFCGYNKRLYNFDGINWTKHEIPEDYRLLCAEEDMSGKLWVGSWGGLYSFDGNDWEYHDLDNDGKKERVDCLFVADNNDLYVAIYYEGVWKFDGNTWAKIEGLPHEWVVSMYQSTNGDIWFGFAYAGLVKYDGTTIIHYDDDFLYEDRVYEIYQAPDGSMWFVGPNMDGEKYGVAKMTNWE